MKDYTQKIQLQAKKNRAVGNTTQKIGASAQRHCSEKPATGNKKCLITL
jgi:hypothetical protein